MDSLKIDLEIVTPARLVVSETVDEVVLPGSEGYLGVLPGHAPLLTGLGAGEIGYRSSGRARYLAVSGGFAEVLQHRVSVLAETCERAEEIDVSRATDARDRAKTEVVRPDATETEIRHAASRLERAEVRIAVAKRAIAG
ncbi:MAG: F0F1 ATP synthase subunit epsilon [Acidobacteriia bacterium]|jgi:F-type H+-transporting ATPase subunit epsilon|nr:F0F1 ATP synthase subunit epsilon [Terriglobia bacterium]